MTWIQTHSGIAFDLAAPTVAMVKIEDIAVALSRQCRFAGHCKRFYSVAEHSVLVSRLIDSDVAPRRRLALYGLLHDAHEAYIGDLLQPIKVLARQQGATFYAELEARVEAVVLQAFGFDPGPTPPEVKHADLVALAIEKRDLMAASPRPWAELPTPPPGFHLDPTDPVFSRDLFLRRFHKLGGLE